MFNSPSSLVLVNIFLLYMSSETICTTAIDKQLICTRLHFVFILFLQTIPTFSELELEYSCM